ncbi:signal recognition particle protein dpa [Thermoplasma volcanium GSS1]|uniref:Signal recognition particle receptor FtsY n=1 Tax=Thermoplasma volcanium (strain ATCC 51530 / DSM 4299 / JCM 9571 / NBRC 15438 / GSS1) TaxID=273116 RepID=Q97BC4_THEVO|nr:signal recognition particle-docking protein FtsY [Thermoplasma volcanium]BAB59674.1 signal recognition particle protein dpa [Thermoplasma volcanium GSS1]
MFEKFKKKLVEIFSRKKIDPDEAAEEIPLKLIEADVSVETAEYLGNLVRNKLKDRDFSGELNDVLYASIKEILAIPKPDILNVNKKPFVIMFLGINGTGKTTTIGKVAKYLKSKGKSVVLSASDTFRAGAIEQLSMIGKEIGVEVIKHEKGSDPSSVAFDAIQHAKARNIDYVLVDTAGRMNTNKNLMDEMKKIKRVSNPDITLLVLDAVAGQDSINQARTFHENVGFDAVIVTKLDTDARGGSILSIYHDLRKPVLFACVGQGLDDIMQFDADWYIEKLMPENSIA